MLADRDAVKLSIFEKYAGPVAVALAGVVSLMLTIWVTTRDLGQMLPVTKAFVSGDWSHLYPPKTSATSMTGWVVIVALPYAAATKFIDSGEAFVFAGLVSVPLLLGSVRYTLGVMWPSMSAVSAWMTALVAVSLPTTLACWFNYYHPQDAAATALTVLGLGLAIKKKWVLSGIIFGVAVMTRQWVILGAVPLAALAGRDAWKFVTTAAAACITLLLPVVITGGNSEWFSAMTGSSTLATKATLMGTWRTAGELAYASGGTNTALIIARAAPMLLTVVLSTVVTVKRKLLLEKHGNATFVAVVSSGFALRMLFEGADYPYYWVPFPVLILLLTPVSKAMWWAVAATTTLPWVLNTLLSNYQIETITQITRGLLVLLLAAACGILPWLTQKNDHPKQSLFTQEEKNKEMFNRPKGAWVISGAVVVAVTILILGSVTPMLNLEAKQNFLQQQAPELTPRSVRQSGEMDGA